MVIAAPKNIQVMLLQRNSEEIIPGYGNCWKGIQVMLLQIACLLHLSWSVRLYADYGKCCLISSA